jgi:hypothetical protein
MGECDAFHAQADTLFRCRRAQRVHFARRGRNGLVRGTLLEAGQGVD